MDGKRGNAPGCGPARRTAFCAMRGLVAAEEFVSSPPIGPRYILEYRIYIVRICSCVVDDAFGDFGGQGLYSGYVLSFEPANTYYGHDDILVREGRG